MYMFLVAAINMDTLEAYASVVITILLLVIAPVWLLKEQTDYITSRNDQYETDYLAWQLETKHEINTSFFSKDFNIMAYSDGWNMTDIEISDHTLILNPSTAKYVHIIYGEKDRWIILE